MEKIIKLAQKNYDFGLQSHLLKPYFHDLSTKPENVEVIANYTIKELRAKKANASLLFLLNAFVDKCPGSVFSQHGGTWLQLLIRNAADNQGNLTTILKILTNVIRNIVINNCKKELDAKAIEKVVEFCTQLSSRNSVLESLNCLELVLKSYPEHCSFISKKVNQYLLQFVDNSSREITNQVAICFVTLYQVKGGLCKGTTLEQSWMQLQTSLLANIFTTINCVLEEEHFLDVKLIAGGAMTLETTVLSKPILCQRILNLVNYLNTALLMPLPIAKPIFGAKIIDLIYRVLEENSPFFSDKNLQRDITIGPFLHHLHETFLQLLRSMMIVLRSNALLFNKTICAVLKIVLKRSSRSGNHPYQFEYRAQKIFMYELVRDWIQIAKSGQDIEAVVQLTLQDIWDAMKSFEGVIKENQDDKSKLLTKEKGAKKRKRHSGGANDQSKAEPEHKNISHIVDACLTMAAALECLDGILSIFGHSLNSNLHHSVLTNVHLFAKRLLVDASKWELPLWSDDYNLLEGVCKVLITFNSSSHHMHRSSINYTLSLLEMMRSYGPQNRQLCLSFHNNLETIFHYPRAPVTIINPSSALLQEPEIEHREKSHIDVDSSEEEDDACLITEADESEITSTVDNGQTEAEVGQANAETVKTFSETEAIEIADHESVSSEEQDGGKDEVVTIDEDESVEIVLQGPVDNATTPVKAKRSRLSEEVTLIENSENQASIDDIMADFVDEVV